MNAGLDVKKSEVHGMSQRGGVVSSHVKIAPKVYSPTIPQGQVDIVLSFEKAEALRWTGWMRKDSIAIVSQTTLIPAIVTSSKQYHYPEDAIEQLKKKIHRVISVPADQIAGELGNPRLVNTILLGVLSNYLPFDHDLWVDCFKAKIKPKLVDINLEAFKRGRDIRLTPVTA
jgi:indolepyruvate ferredoxin oxidoreductase beta subunit